jgi:S-adenosyl methyltransferase
VSESSCGVPPAGQPGGVSGLPSVARIYDALLDGTGNRAADRDAARQLTEVIPGAARAARDNRAFVGRTVKFLAEKQDVGQFVDIGSGPLMARGNVHEIALAADPGARVVYADNDPVVIADSRARVAGARSVIAVEGDLRYPRLLLAMREVCELIDFSRPVAVLLAAVLHFVPDSDHPWRSVKEISACMAPGSYFVISHVTGDEIPEEAVRRASAIYNGALIRGAARGKDEIMRFFDDLDMIPPGLVDVAEWRPGHRARTVGGPALFWAGIGRKPGSGTSRISGRRSAVNQPGGTVSGRGREPGALMCLVADGLTARGFGVRRPERDSGRRLVITGLAGMRCELAVHDSAYVEWECLPVAGGRTDPRLIADLATVLLTGKDQGRPRGGDGGERAGITLKGIVGRELAARGLNVMLDVYEDREFYSVTAEIVASDPGTEEEARVRVGDDGSVTWEWDYWGEAAAITWEPEFSWDIADRAKTARVIAERVIRAISYALQEMAAA